MKTTKLLNVLLIALIPAAVYVVLIEMLLLFPPKEWLFGKYRLYMLSADDIISLMSGAITAAGLTVIYIQIQGTRRDVERRACEDRHNAALRADLLHAEFNSEPMRKARDRGYIYLQQLNDDQDRIMRLAKKWVHDDVNVNIFCDAKASGEALKATKEDEQALSSMIAFFARVMAHINLHQADLTPLQIRNDVLGPFFPTYWLHNGLMDLAVACAYFHNIPAASDKPKYEPLYFVQPILDLARIYNIKAKFKYPKNIISSQDSTSTCAREAENS